MSFNLDIFTKAVKITGRSGLQKCFDILKIFVDVIDPVSVDVSGCRRKVPPQRNASLRSGHNNQVLRPFEAAAVGLVVTLWKLEVVGHFSIDFGIVRDHRTRGRRRFTLTQSRGLNNGIRLFKTFAAGRRQTGSKKYQLKFHFRTCDTFSCFRFT